MTFARQNNMYAKPLQFAVEFYLIQLFLGWHGLSLCRNGTFMKNSKPQFPVKDFSEPEGYLFALFSDTALCFLELSH